MIQQIILFPTLLPAKLNFACDWCVAPLPPCRPNASWEYSLSSYDCGWPRLQNVFIRKIEEWCGTRVVTLAAKVNTNIICKKANAAFLSRTHYILKTVKIHTNISYTEIFSAWINNIRVKNIDIFMCFFFARNICLSILPPLAPTFERTHTFSNNKTIVITQIFDSWVTVTWFMYCSDESSINIKLCIC